VDGLANINAVVQQAVDVILGDRLALLGGDAIRPQLTGQNRGRTDLGKAVEHDAHGFGFGFVDDQFSVFHVIAQGHRPAHPHAFFARGRNLVADALAGNLALELGKAEKDVQGQPPHRRRGIEGLCHGNKCHTVAVEHLDQLGKVHQRARQPVDFVDHNHIDQPLLNIRQQQFQTRPLQRAARHPAVIVMLITGGELRGLGLDPDRLIEGGLLERRDRQDIVLIDEDDIDGEVAIEPSSTPGMVKVTGPFGEDAGEYPLADMERFQLNRQWLQETVLRLVGSLLTKKGPQIIDEDLILLGDMGVDGASTPVYFARRLGDPPVINKLDQLLRARNTSGIGIVLSSSPATLTCLGPNVVVPILSHLEKVGEEQELSRDAVVQILNSGRNLAMGGSTVAIHRAGSQNGTVFVPGKPPLHLLGANQITIFERLVKAHLDGVPDVKAGTLVEGTQSRSPQHAFRKATWDGIKGVYIIKGAKHGFWRLAV